MSIWWAKKEQLDDAQLALIEDLPLQESHLVLGPPGSGKTNVLLRRAQFARSQGDTNILVLTFTRSLTEFVKTGCYNQAGQEIFPVSLVNTIEGWVRELHRTHQLNLPGQTLGMSARKASIAQSAIGLASAGKMPAYDAIFVDEAQDLLEEEFELIKAWTPVVFLVGDDRQKIYEGSAGIEHIRKQPNPPNEHKLPFHYRLAPDLCKMADKISPATGGAGLAKSSLYDGPKPGHIEPHGPTSRVNQIAAAADNIGRQLRAYADLIVLGDKIGIVVPGQNDREAVHAALEAIPHLNGKSQIVRANSGTAADRGYDPSLDPNCPILILTEKGCKGLEFRAAHWLFCDENDHFRSLETYYTVVTRAKTSLDLYFDGQLPATLAKSYSPPSKPIW